MIGLVNGESIVEFFTKTRELYSTDGNIHRTPEGAGYHSAIWVTDAAKRLGITLHYLPADSPNLNPIERL